MNDKIYDKIKKLMALSSSDFEGESNAALTMANSLMEQYNISMADLDEYGRSQEFGELVNKAKEEAKLYKIWEKRLVSALSRLFNCQVVVEHPAARKSQIHILGREGNVKTVIAMNDWITNKIKADAKKKFPGRAMAERNSYAIGVVDTLCVRIDDMVKNRDAQAEEAGWGLVAVDEVNSFMKSQYPALRNTKTRTTVSSAGAYGSGRSDGNNIGLNKQFGLKAITA